MSIHVHDRVGQATPYFRQIDAQYQLLAAQFPGKETIHITSLEDPLRQMTGGRVFEVSLHTAAKRIVERTHQISTAEEIANEVAFRNSEIERLNTLEEKRKQTSILKPSEEQMASQASLVAVTVRAVLQELAPMLGALQKAPEQPGKTPRSGARAGADEKE